MTGELRSRCSSKHRIAESGAGFVLIVAATAPAARCEVETAATMLQRILQGVESNTVFNGANRPSGLNRAQATSRPPRAARRAIRDTAHATPRLPGQGGRASSSSFKMAKSKVGL